MKKKIHFVSDFKLYNDINMDSNNPHTFQQAMQAANLSGLASNFLQPPAITRNNVASPSGINGANISLSAQSKLRNNFN